MSRLSEPQSQLHKDDIKKTFPSDRVLRRNTSRVLNPHQTSSLKPFKAKTEYKLKLMFGLELHLVCFLLPVTSAVITDEQCLPAEGRYAVVVL